VATAGDVYVGSGTHVVCLDASNGSLCWPPPFTADSRVVTAPVVRNGVNTIYVGTLDGNVYALTPGRETAPRALAGGAGQEWTGCLSGRQVDWTGQICVLLRSQSMKGGRPSP
jgi:PQQ-like domain